jgi:hypothetical protein
MNFRIAKFYKEMYVGRQTLPTNISLHNFEIQKLIFSLVLLQSLSNFGFLLILLVFDLEYFLEGVIKAV